MKLFNKKDDSWFLSLELGPTKLVVVRLSDAGFRFQLTVLYTRTVLYTNCCDHERVISDTKRPTI